MTFKSIFIDVKEIEKKTNICVASINMYEIKAK